MVVKAVKVLGLVAAVIAIVFLFRCGSSLHSSSSDHKVDGRTSASFRSDTSVKKVAKQGSRSPASNPPDAATLEIGESEIEELRNVFASYETKLKTIEFRNSILRWEGRDADKVARLYELRPLSKEDLQQIDKSIDDELAGHRLSKEARKYFAKNASKTVEKFVIPAGKGYLYISIPANADKNVMTCRNVEDPNIDQMVKELTDSNGANVAFPGRSVEMLLSNRAAEDWRYSQFYTDPDSK